MTKEISPNASRLIHQIAELDRSGALTGSKLQLLQRILDGAEEIHQEIEKIIKPISPWLPYKMSETFYKQLKPQEWECLKVIADRPGEEITDFEIAEDLGYSNPSSAEARGAVRKILGKLMMIMTLDDENGTIESSIDTYKGVHCITYKWSPFVAKVRSKQ